MSKHSTQVVKDLKEKSILVAREFDATVELVWKAFTDHKILDQWWGPAPWKAETKYQDFSPGGYWLYAMVGPEKEKHWARMNYLSIEEHQSIQLEDAFCDENGVLNNTLPVSKGSKVFIATSTGTLVEFRMNYSSEEQLQMIVEMGFEQGISACLDQLDDLIIHSRIG